MTAVLGLAVGAFFLEEMIRGLFDRGLTAATVVLAAIVAYLVWTYAKLPTATRNATRAHELNEKFLVEPPAADEPSLPSIADRALAGAFVVVLWVVLMMTFNTLGFSDHPGDAAARQGVISGVIFAVLIQGLNGSPARRPQEPETDPPTHSVD